MRAIVLAALFALGACHRPQVDQPTPGADGEAQARSAAKTIADLQAADEASRGPAPTIAPAHPPRVEKAKVVRSKPAAAATDEDTVEADNTTG